MTKSSDIPLLAKKWKEIILALWDDPTLKQALLENPEETLSKLEFKVSNNQCVKIHENTESTLHLVIPKKPQTELSDEVLSHVVAGFHYGGE